LKPHERHRAGGPKKVSVALVTVSTSRYAAKRLGKEWTDESRDVALREMARLGYKVVRTELVSDVKPMIRREVRRFLAGSGDVLVFMGGTGISSRDVTIETVRPLFDKELEGFGELVRLVGHRKIGAAAFLSRATAGVAKGKLVLCLPGSPGAARDALRAFGREIPHALFIARS
jgi:molybdenum cofactor biosynthesis protein B